MLTKYLLLPPPGGAISGEWGPVLIWASVRCCCPSTQDRHDCIWHTGLQPDPQQNQPLTPTARVDQPASAGQCKERIWAHEWIQVWHDNQFRCLIWCFVKGDFLKILYCRHFFTTTNLQFCLWSSIYLALAGVGFKYLLPKSMAGKEHQQHPIYLLIFLQFTCICVFM